MNRLAALALAAFVSWGASAQQITVSAASSLQNALRDIGVAYQAAHPGRQVTFRFAASGVLLAQMARGTTADVFASADIETMDKAEAEQLIKAETRVNAAGNALVLISPLSRPAGLKALGDLKKPGFARIAVGSPSSVAAGRYAESALMAQGLWADLNPKFVFVENVRQALDHVSRAEADAGFVYRTDALLEQGKVRIDLTVPTTRPVVYPLAVVRASQHSAAALEFIQFVMGARGQAVLAKHGFSPAP